MFDAIKTRVSVRDFEKRPLSFEDEKSVQEILDDVGKKRGPFGHRADFFSCLNKSRDKINFGTYGFIKHPPMFIGGVIANTTKGMVDYGFLFEEAVLRITELGLGTVWLGGSFDRSTFHVNLGMHGIIPAVSPVGYPSDTAIKKRLTNKKRDYKWRKPFDTLFFIGEDFERMPEDHQFNKYLEAMRLAPSASNKQPWRIILKDETIHLYLKRILGYDENAPMDTQAIDAGIALSHLSLTLKEDGYSTEFIHEKPMDINECDYILSLKVTP